MTQQQEAAGESKGSDDASYDATAFKSAKEKVEAAYESAVSDVKAKIEKAKSEALKKIQQQSSS